MARLEDHQVSGHWKACRIRQCNMKTIENLRGIAGFGRCISVLTAVLTVISLGVAVSTPPLSGPFCTGECFRYPYTDIAGRFPRDYYWMVPAILSAFSFLAMMATVHVATPQDRKHFSLTGLGFAMISALILSADYFIQLSFIQPALLAGETEGIAALSQYNPHGIFIILEELGFMTMNIALFCLFPVFRGLHKPSGALRVTLMAGFILMIISFASVLLAFGMNREYRFEVIIISITWIELIIAGFLLGRYFKRLKNQPEN